MDHKGGLPVPVSRYPVRVRPAVVGDLAFIDALAKKHKAGVGWTPMEQFEGYLAKGYITVAENVSAQPIGYCIAGDKYFKREDVGIVYQMNVEPGYQRGLVAATLLKALFDGWPYGVRLCCCWCAQDLGANRFWEAMGFVPLAFRTGSIGKKVKGADGVVRVGRVHIFWERRVRRDDVEMPWWYPSQTGSGAVRADRLVFPIPPGRGWYEEMPRVVPGVSEDGSASTVMIPIEGEAVKMLEGEKKKEKSAKPRAVGKKKKKEEVGVGVAKRGGLWFAPTKEEVKARKEEAKAEGKRRKKAAVKNDPRLVAAARELRDRWLEGVNAGRVEGLPEAGGRYEVGRVVEGGDVEMVALPGEGGEGRMMAA